MGKWRRNLSLPRRWQKSHLIKKYGNICSVCEEPFLNKKEITIDHVIPESKGGLDVIENMKLAHDRCNQLKGNMTPEEFVIFQRGGELVE